MTPDQHAAAVLSRNPALIRRLAPDKLEDVMQSIAVEVQMAVETEQQRCLTCIETHAQVQDNYADDAKVAENISDYLYAAQKLRFAARDIRHSRQEE